MQKTVTVELLPHIRLDNSIDECVVMRYWRSAQEVHSEEKSSRGPNHTATLVLDAWVQVQVEQETYVGKSPEDENRS